MRSLRTSCENTTLCIMSCYPDSYSQTFIRAHIDRLPAKVVLLDRAYLSRCRGKRKSPFTQGTLLNRLTPPTFRGKLKAIGDYYRETVFRRFLVNSRAGAVLAEFGPTGVAAMEMCQEAKTPPIVHFHVFHAYHSEAIEPKREPYHYLLALIS